MKKKNLNNSSKVIIKYQYFFKKKTIIYGNIQNILPFFLKKKKFIIFIKKYDFLKYVPFFKKKYIIYFGIQKIIFKFSNCIIFFWSKNKKESLVEIKKLIKLLPIKCIIYIIGDKNSGIKSVKKELNSFIQFQKFINIRHCIFIQGFIKNNKHTENIQIIKNNKNNFFFLPGVFSYNEIDQGSLFLLSTFKKKIKGNILDLGCGIGILGIYLLKKYNRINITFSDICLNSLIVTKKNILSKKINNKKYKIIYSNIFSNINKKYDIIVCNPPIHNDLKINLYTFKKILYNFKYFIKKNGFLRIVVNNVISKNIIRKINKNFFIYKKNKKFCIYQFYLKNNTQSGT
ncbi:methyltransferase [Buchnera aphidicola (Mollitrichosiphum nigrofasciatum)]|uniref:methyltransferase n=1 Tax=Buchnera aphidicola TaxID=9 RepID=UPI0031B86213